MAQMRLARLCTAALDRVRRSSIRSAAKPSETGSNFDTSRFEFTCDFGCPRKWRHFRCLAARTPVSGEENQASDAEGLESRGASLLAEFSISKICVQGCPEAGCVSAETGS